VYGTPRMAQRSHLVGCSSAGVEQTNRVRRRRRRHGSVFLKIHEERCAIHEERQYLPNPSKGIGLGLLKWESRVQALQVRWIIRYLDASNGQWKEVLDRWLARGTMGRGTCFTTAPLTYMIKSNNTTATALPKFWVRALQALRKLTLNQGSPGQCATQEEAKAMPVFYNPLFEIRNRKHMDSWTELLQLRTIGDSRSTRGTRQETTACPTCGTASKKLVKWRTDSLYPHLDRT
jgi:hypothetical protein